MFRSCVAMALLTLWLPLAATGADQPSQEPSAATAPRPREVEPLSAETLEQAIRRGVAFLVEIQNKDGSFGSPFPARTADVYAPVPGAHQAFRAAVTSMCISALLEAGGDSAEVAQAIDRAEAWLLDNLPRVRRATPTALYNNWSHAYAIQALVGLWDRAADDTSRRTQIRQLISGQLEMLTRYECVDGGWAYYDFNAQTKKPSGTSMCFLTATVLVALKETQPLGIDIPPSLIERATASIRRQRKRDFSYCYSESFKYYPMYPINRPSGSLGRSQACNLATRLWGDQTVTDTVLRTWLDRLFARNLWLELGRKRPIPHESWSGVAGYFFYYGHYYGALCIEQLPEDQRPPYANQMARLLVELQEKDGCWWDFPLYNYHRQYGTAFALMALARCRS